MTTFAPAARHACACAFCFCGSFSALVIEAVTPAALNAFAKSGASKSTQRTDDLVSGSRTQTWTFAAFFFVLAVAPATATTAASAATMPTRANDFLLESFLTLVASSSCTGEKRAPILLSYGNSASVYDLPPTGHCSTLELPSKRLFVVRYLPTVCRVTKLSPVFVSAGATRPSL